MRNLYVIPLITWLVLTSHSFAADLEWVRVSNDQRSFVLETSGSRFVPWGFNYDQDRNGQLIEDYWDKKPDEYRKSKTIRDAIVLSWLELFQEKGKTILEQSPLGSVDCEGTYGHHLQPSVQVRQQACYHERLHAARRLDDRIQRCTLVVELLENG